MPIFKKKKKTIQVSPANPTLDSVSIPTSQSLLDLNQNIFGKDSGADADADAAPTDQPQLQTQTQLQGDLASASNQSIERPPPGSYTRKPGRAPIPPSSPSSPSSGSVQQFHRPQISRGPPPSSFSPKLYHPSTLPLSFSANHNHNDFRQSPFANPPPDPAEQRKAHEMARNQSLKRSKVPKSLNLMVAGSKNSGKTSWIRSFLETLELGSALSVGAGVKEAAGGFGISPVTLTPIPTTSISTLSSLPVSDQALLQALPESLQDLADSAVETSNETSIKRSSSISGSGYGQPSCRLLLSITDTPGLDFQREDEFQLERKVSSTIRFIEEKMRETLIEEKKIDRRSYGGFNSQSGVSKSQHVHALLYFIDSENLVMREVGPDSRSEMNKVKNGSSPSEITRQSSSRNLVKESRLNHIRQNSKSEHDVSSKKTLKRSNSESSLGASKLALKNSIKSLNGHEEEESKKPKKSELSLSDSELKILKRLSERVNIIPVIGCSDKLTENQLLKVREAIKRSLKEVLGEKDMFEILGGKFSKGSEDEEGDEEDEEITNQPLRFKGGRRNHKKDCTDTPPSVNFSPTIEDGETEESSEGVKLIRIKSRRSFSRTALTDSTFEMEPESHRAQQKTNTADRDSIGMSRSASSTSSLGYTSPLFSRDQDSHPLSKLVSSDIPSLEKIYPFALISPEISFEKSKVSIGLGRARSGSRGRSLSNASVDAPNRTRTLSNSNLNQETESSKIGLGIENPNLSSIETESNVPPVPPIPAQLQQTKNQVQEDSKVPNSPPSQDINHAASLPDQAQVSSSHGGPKRTSSSSSSILSRPRPSVSSPRGPHPFDPNRFIRKYKWSRINLLDVDHCDFLPLRALLLKTNVENLLKRTDNLYEIYRSQRLESRRETREVPEAQERLMRSLSLI